MESACLTHTLTEAEHAAFERDGFFLIPGALTRTEAAHFASVVDEVDVRCRGERGLGAEERLNLHDTIGHDERLLDLIDWPTTFPKVWGILGWNIQLYHTQMIVTPPARRAEETRRLGWHQDNNRMNRDLEVELQPRISLKVAYFLNDLLEEGMANLYVLPGTHLMRQLLPPREGDPNPAGAMAVTARVGDAILFDRRLWHAASPNRSPVTRKVLFYGYSHRWLRPKCDMDTSRVWERCDPIRRQLLGARTTANGYFDPQEGDVPLRAWLCEHLGAQAVAA
jgi:ectoine hydroxylase